MTRRSVPLLVTTGLVVAVVLVMWAAVSGPGQVLGGEGRDRVPLTQPTASESSVYGEAGDQEQERRSAEEVSPVLRAVVRGIVLVLELTVALAACWLVWRGGRSAWQRWDARRRRDGLAEDLTGAEELFEEEQVLRGLLLGSDGRRDRLASGEPRNAVVACWLELESLVAAQGVARDPAETSTELARRCLDRTGADPDAVGVLAAAYHRARYADVPVTDADRSRALRALDRVHASLAEQLRRGART